ncbi:carboxypeptidase-like regulatory domain-containing protein [Chitinophaga pinensis]|uniref:carboxypeptidase-like regulatory domain-containing protein n=1 Tax=Chitinophaga pinensis TaxID=79329 RepID=UPI001C9A1C89|nr:carboxypeptidase-like regulatory domain-containing protein [Chitinophaga pinensis]
MKGVSLFCIILFFFAQHLHAQSIKVTLSGQIKDAASKRPLPFVSVTLKKAKDTSFISGTISGDDGRFKIADLNSGNYLLEFSYIGYQPLIQTLTVGQLSPVLELGSIELAADPKSLNTVTITGKQEEIRLDKKPSALRIISVRQVALYWKL